MFGKGIDGVQMSKKNTWQKLAELEGKMAEVFDSMGYWRFARDSQLRSRFFKKKAKKGRK